jgi:hypothetical protein
VVGCDLGMGIDVEAPDRRAAMSTSSTPTRVSVKYLSTADPLSLN